MISEKRGEFGDPENQLFRRNRGIFRVKVSEKGCVFSTWRTLMGHPNSLRVGVPGIYAIVNTALLYLQKRTRDFNREFPEP